MTKTIRPSTINYTSGGKFQTFSNLNNIKKDNDYAQALIHGKNQPLNRPSTLTVKNFNAGLPTGAVVSKITVEIKHSKAPYNNKNCNVPAPSISLMNGNKVFQYSKTTKTSQKRWNNKTGRWEYVNVNVHQDMTKKAKAPTTSAVTNTVTFNSTWNYDEINSSDFGVKIDYPTNTNDNEGYVRLYYVKVILTYRTANFGVKIDHVGGEYNGDRYGFFITCSNVNNVKYAPTLTIDAPLGFSLNSAETLGTFTQVSARTFTWKPKLGLGKGSDTLGIIFDSNITFGTNVEKTTKTFNVTESLAGHSSSKTVNVLKNRPVNPSVDETHDNKQMVDTKSPPASNRIVVAYGEEFELITTTTYSMVGGELHVPQGLSVVVKATYYSLGSQTPTTSTVSKNRTSNGKDIYIIPYSHQSPNKTTVSLKVNALGYFPIGIVESAMYYYHDMDFPGYDSLMYCSVAPLESGLSTPKTTILTLSEEELNRLGDGHVYTAQTFMKETTSEDHVHEWYKNFRIGVFNNRIESGVIDSLFNVQVINNQEMEFRLSSQVSSRNVARIQIKLDNPVSIATQTQRLEEISSTEFAFQRDVFSIVQDANGTYPEVNFEMTLYNGNAEVSKTITGYVNFDEGTYILSDNYFDPHDYSNLGLAQIVANAEYWSPALRDPNVFENLECKFGYNKDYPVHIIIVGDYSEASPSASIQFTEPCLIEDYKSHATNGVYPAPILDVIGGDAFADIQIPIVDKSDTVVLYDFPLQEHFGSDDDMVIRGLAVTGTVDSNTDDLVLNASLVNDENTSKNRSIVLDENNPKNYTDNEFTIGQVGDLWGFKTNEIKDLEDWEVHVNLSNALNNFQAQASFGNLSLIVYAEDVIDQLQRWFVEEEDLSYYGVFLQDVKIPVGLKTDTKYLEIDGTDLNDPYSQKIVSKTIEVEFTIDGCDLESSTLALREVTRLLTTKRDKAKRPVPKRVEFSHYPDVFWEYLMEEPIDAEVEGSSYQCKAKLVIPAGTSYDTKVTSTSNTGYVSGLAAVKPIIQVSPSDNVISIVETESEQEFNMGYSGDWLGKIIEIDCDDRIAWLKESEDDDDPVNISQYVDINADWFILNGEYAFETVGCAIRSVDWQERW